MRESWFLKNIHSRDLTISDLDKAPAIAPNGTVDMLLYHTKQEIEQSDSLKDAIDLGYVSLIKRRDNETTVKVTPDDINISIENAELAESVRFCGEMYADEANITVIIASANVAVQVPGPLTSGPMRGIAFQNGNELRVIMPGTYYMSWSISVTTGGAAGQELEGAIFKNGARQPSGTGHSTTVAANKFISFSGNSIIQGLVADDVMSMSVTNRTMAVDIVVQHLNFVMLRIGD